eukprot:TRINITY_DN10452_c0_g1_i4.p1 TRINITY_DN10452_c0_g1~~TRINITY_DN10452_c0_g1_i4.p1  ORF type:complete len:320 (-),score=39.59 TRINITY_DN10452_c0_g1_i4:338-1297(-)
MMTGGNGRARQFFKQHGWEEIGADKIGAKYTSRAAQLYRQLLEKESNQLQMDNLQDHTKVQQIETEEQSSSQVQDQQPQVASSSESKANISSSVDRTQKSKVLGAKRLGGSSAKKPSLLGAKKMGTKVDDALYSQTPEEPSPQPAIGEENNAGQVGGSRFTYEEVTKSKKEKAPDVERGQDGHISLSTNTDDFFKSPMGGSVSIKKKLQKQQEETNGDDHTARDKFANAKSISSDKFYAQGSESDLSQLERDSRLNRYHGATAISSDFFDGDGQDNDQSQKGGNRVATQVRQDLRNVKQAAGKAGRKIANFVNRVINEI